MHYAAQYLTKSKSRSLSITRQAARCKCAVAKSDAPTPRSGHEAGSLGDLGLVEDEGLRVPKEIGRQHCYSGRCPKSAA